MVEKTRVSGMDIGRIFSRGGGKRGFFQNFSARGGKSGEICFFPLETAKTTFLCCNFQNPGVEPRSPFRRPWFQIAENRQQTGFGKTRVGNTSFHN